MAGYRKLGRTSDQRKAMLRSLTTALINNGKIVTTEARAKEVKKIVEGMIALAVKEKDNYEVVKVTAKVARKDADGKRVKEVVDGKKVTVYDEVQKIVEGMIALAVKEKDNYETVKVTAKVARKDANGKRVKEVVDGKKVTV
ncbi:MAG: 50S ribosomal protein L17, partial [Lachnospiraceae bacterium]|nr:50S ribosomal protein L17 [Lachnospiraceae bacterium]